MGQWTATTDCWDWFFSPSEGAVYRRGAHIWRKFSTSGRTRSTSFRALRWATGWVTALPDNLAGATVRVSATWKYTHVVVTGIGIDSPPLAPSPVASVRDAWLHARLADEWAPEWLRVSGNEALLVAALEAGDLRVVSDGSYKDGIGTASVVVTNPSKTAEIRINCRVPGARRDQSAYRSDLLGMLCGLTAASWLASAHKTLGSAVYACDSLSAFPNAFANRPLHPMQAQFDVLLAIRGLRSSSREVNWSTRHVRGHQDDNRPWRSLDWWERVNVINDGRAQLLRRKYSRSALVDAPNPWFPTERWVFFSKGIKQSCLRRSVIEAAVTTPPLLAYWHRRARFPPEAVDFIHWDAIERASNDSAPSLCRWVTKHTVGMCAVGKFHKIWGHAPTDECPRCGRPEDTLHVTRCPSLGACEEWAEQMSEMSA
jgi:hypothetical protein